MTFSFLNTTRWYIFILWNVGRKFFRYRVLRFEFLLIHVFKRIAFCFERQGMKELVYLWA